MSMYANLGPNGWETGFYYPIDPMFEVWLQRKGVLFNGSSDDADAIQEAIDAFTEPGKYKVATFPGGGVTAKILSGLTINTNALAVDFGGLTIDASDMASGTALTLVGQAVIPYNIGSCINELAHLKLLGPGTDAGLVDGIALGGATTPGHFTARNIHIQGFRDNINIGNNHYIQNWHNCHSLYAHRYGLNYAGTTNTGESINWFAGSISDCQNAGGTAIAIYVPAASGGPDMHFWGTSGSYNDQVFDIGCGTISFNKFHMESDTNNPMGKVSYTGGRPATIVVIDGGVVTGNGTAQGTTVENTKGRPVMFLIDSATGDRCGLAVRNVKWPGYGKSETEFIQFTGAGRPSITHDGLVIDEQNNNIGKISQRTSMLHNGGFESHVSQGWTVSAGTATITQDAAVFATGAVSNGGSKSLKVVGTTSTATYSQTIPVSGAAGKTVVLRGLTNCTAVSAGNATIKMYMYAADGTTSISTPTIATISATQTGFTLLAQKHKIPAGVVSIKVELAVTGFTGTIYFDDIDMWVL